MAVCTSIRRTRDCMPPPVDTTTYPAKSSSNLTSIPPSRTRPAALNTSAISWESRETAAHWLIDRIEWFFDRTPPFPAIQAALLAPQPTLATWSSSALVEISTWRSPRTDTTRAALSDAISPRIYRLSWCPRPLVNLLSRSVTLQMSDDPSRNGKLLILSADLHYHKYLLPLLPNFHVNSLCAIIIINVFMLIFM